MNEPKSQGILSHILELRQRFIWCLVALLITSSASFFFVNQIMTFLKAPAGNVQFVYIEVAEALITYMKVCFITGIILAMPYIMYQALMFIMPALTSREKKAVLTIMPAITICFFGGAYLGYRFLIPPAAHFLLSLGSNVALIEPRLSAYVTFVISLMFIFGLISEMPVVVAFLTRLGVVSSRWLWNKQKWVAVIAFFVAALINPTSDVVSQIVVGIALMVLYEVSIVVAWVVERFYKKTAHPVTSLT